MTATARSARRVAAVVAALILVVVVGIVAETTMSGHHASASPQLRKDEEITRTALDRFSYRNGEWMPSQYRSPSWEKYQAPAVASAALGTAPSGTSAQRDVAIDTVNTAISRHQLPNGDFDNGTPASGTSGVWGGFWAEAQGLIAITLHGAVPTATLRRWEQSMASYVRYLETSHQTTWYANGNVVLRQAVIMLETHRLAQLVGDPRAASYWQEYLAEKRFLVNPAATQHRGDPNWATYGQYTGSGGQLWFDESTASAPQTRITCANGQTPCRGFDANYTTAQLHDATVGYAVGGDDRFWGSVIEGEHAALAPRISGGQLHAANGSRDNIPREPFYPSIYGILAKRDGRNYDAAWSQQLQAMQTQMDAYEKLPDPGPNAYSLMSALAVPVIQELGDSGT